MTHPYQQQQQPQKTISDGRKPVTTRHHSWESQIIDGVKKVGKAAMKEVAKDAVILGKVGQAVLKEVVKDAAIVAVAEIEQDL